MTALEQLIPQIDRGWDALEAGDLDTFAEGIKDQADPDCTFHSGIGSVVGGGIYEGVDGILEWFSDLLATTSDRRWRNRSYEVHGNNVLLFLADFEFTGAASGATVSGETGAVAEYKSGRCVRIVSFTSHAEARAEAEALVA